MEMTGRYDYHEGSEYHGNRATFGFLTLALVAFLGGVIGLMAGFYLMQQQNQAEQIRRAQHSVSLSVGGMTYSCELPTVYPSRK